jgi:hypothetical protein
MEKQGGKRKDLTEGGGVETGLQRKVGDGDRKWQAYRQGGSVRVVKWNVGRKNWKESEIKDWHKNKAC